MDPFFQDAYPRNRYDPMPEGVEQQRMDPQVERLVFQSEQIGYFKYLRKQSQEFEQSANTNFTEAMTMKLDRDNYKRLYNDCQLQVEQLNKKLNRLMPKKGKKK